MAEPYTKRRRVNQTVANKPFKSPFRPSDKTAAYAGQTSSPKSLPGPIGRATASETSRNNPPFNRPQLRQSRILKNPAIAEEEAKQRALSRAIASCRQDIDTLRQATSIIQKDSDDTLEELVIKWRAAARQAAEEVFASSRDRVNRMGGVGAWKERETERMGFWANWDSKDGRAEEAEEYDENGEELDEIEKEERKRIRREMREAMDEESYEPPVAEKSVVSDVNEGDTFTMDMMLNALGISLGLIGWDKERQTWRAER